MRNYFCIYTSEDGIVIEKVNSIDEFLNEAVEDGYTFLSNFPTDRWNGLNDRIDRENFPSMDNPREVILLRGDIVTPIAKTKVTVYELDEDR